MKRKNKGSRDLAHDLGREERITRGRFCHVKVLLSTRVSFFFSFSLRTSQAKRLLRFDLLGSRAGAEMQNWGRGHAWSARRTGSITAPTGTRDLRSLSHQYIFLTMNKSFSICHLMYSPIGADCSTRSFPLFVSLRVLPSTPTLWSRMKNTAPKVIKYHNVPLLKSRSASKEHDCECNCGRFKGCQEDEAERIPLSCHRPANEHNQGKS